MYCAAACANILPLCRIAYTLLLWVIAFINNCLLHLLERQHEPVCCLSAVGQRGSVGEGHGLVPLRITGTLYTLALYVSCLFGFN